MAVAPERRIEVLESQVDAQQNLRHCRSNGCSPRGSCHLMNYGGMRLDAAPELSIKTIGFDGL